MMVAAHHACAHAFPEMPVRQLPLLYLAALALPAAGFSAPAAETELPAPFRSESSLAVRLDFNYRSRPIREILEDVARKTRAPLRATRDTGDERATVLARDARAGEVLATLARQLNFVWYRSNGSYELTHTVAAQRDEAAMRAQARQRRLFEIQRRMDAVVRLTAMNAAQLDDRERAANEAASGAAASPEQRAAAQDEISAIRDSRRPGALLAATIWRGLSPQQVAELDRQGQLGFTTERGTLPAGLAAQVHQAAASSRQRSVSVSRTGGGPELPTTPPERGEPTGASVTVRLSDQQAFRMGPPRSGERQLRLDFSYASIAGDENSRDVMSGVWSPSVGGSPAARPKVETPTDDPVLLKPVEIFAATALTGGGTPPPVAGVVVRTSGNPGNQRKSLAEVAEAIHKTTGLEVLADGYIRARLDPGPISGRLPLVKILDTIANEIEYAWQKTGNRILLRSKLFFEDRPESVPDRILTPWKAGFADKGAPGIDEMASLAAALNDDQARGMEEFWAYYMEGTRTPNVPTQGGVYTQRHDLRFWATLTIAQKRSVRAGEIIPVARMTGLQRTAFAAAVSAPAGGFLPDGGDSRIPAPAEIATGGFSLSVGEMQMHSFSAPGGDGAVEGAVIALGQSRTSSGPRRQGGPPGPPMPPQTGSGRTQIRLPDGRDLDLSLGKGTTLDSFSFSYHLSGNEAPARRAQINLPRADPPAGTAGEPARP